MKKYDEVFKLIEMSVCDVPMTNQEAQIYILIADISGGSEPDAHACRLKLFFITYGCSDVMPYPFEVGREYIGYVQKFRHVSSRCRLSHNEEAFILDRIPTDSPYRTQDLLNRERFIRSAFDVNFDNGGNKNTSKSFAPAYPSYHEIKDYTYVSPAKIDLLDVNKPQVHFLIIYICNFHVLNHFLLMYICKLHW